MRAEDEAVHRERDGFRLVEARKNLQERRQRVKYLRLLTLQELPETMSRA